MYDHLTICYQCSMFNFTFQQKKIWRKKHNPGNVVTKLYIIFEIFRFCVCGHFQHFNIFIIRWQWSFVHSKEVWLDCYSVHQLPNVFCELIDLILFSDSKIFMILECSHCYQGLHSDADPLLRPPGSRLCDRHHGAHQWHRGGAGLCICNQGMAHVLRCCSVSIKVYKHLKLNLFAAR